MKTIKVTAASTAARWGEVDGNIAKTIAAAERAAAEGSQLLLLPECCLTGGEWCTGAKEPRVEDVALDMDGPQIGRIVEAGRRTNMVIVPGKPREWGYSGICCAVDPLGQVIGESKGRAGRPQHLTVTLDESLLRTYVLADVPAIRDRRPEAYRELIDPDLQHRCVKQAPAFVYNERADRLTVEGQR